MFNGDIVYNIIEFDPSYNHKLISKHFYNICSRLQMYMRIWNLDFNDNDLDILDFINSKIMDISIWGNKIDIKWYIQTMYQYHNDTDSDSDNSGGPADINDLELFLAGANYVSFVDNYNDNALNLDHGRMFYFMGVYENVDLFKSLVENHMFISETILSGAISVNSIDFLTILEDHFKTAKNFILSLDDTIASYANWIVRMIIDRMGIKDSIIPNIIRPNIKNMKNKYYIRGLSALHKKKEELNFINLNREIYVNKRPFSGNSEEILNLIVDYEYYDYPFLGILIKDSLEQNYFNVLLKIKKPDRKQMFYYIFKNNIYLNVCSIKWLEYHYMLTQKDYKKIYNTKDVRSLKTALYILSKIIKPNDTPSD